MKKKRFFLRKKKGGTSKMVISSKKSNQSKKQNSVIAMKQLKTPSEKKRNKNAYLEEKVIVKMYEKILNRICPDASQCIVFGREIAKIKSFFKDYDLDGFVKLKEIKRMGKPSLNGFVNEIPFKRGHYQMYAILKSSSQIESDNLLYEAFVGVFVNKLNVYFPCFVASYSIHQYTSPILYNELKENTKITAVPFETSLPLVNNIDTYNVFFNETYLQNACNNSLQYCILIQHLKNIIDFFSFFTSLFHEISESYGFNVQLVIYLYQLYSCLGVLANEFTHYDLHASNLLILNVTPSENSEYIKMVYHYSDNENDNVEFYTSSIIKIIDYGRAYFFDFTENIGSITFRNFLFSQNETIRNNCFDQGFKFLMRNEEKDVNLDNRTFSHVRNFSTDLRSVQNFYWLMMEKKVLNKFKQVKKNNALLKIFENVYLQNTSRSELKHFINFTEEKPTTNEKEINNVHDMHLALKKLIQTQTYFKEDNLLFCNGKKQIGEMHIWLNRKHPVQYIPTPEVEMKSL